MRYLVLLMLFGLTACSSASTSRSDTQAAIGAALDVLEAGFSSEDAILASQPIGEEFFLGSNVGARFSAGAWDVTETTPAVGRFRVFFNDAFAHFANTQLELTLSEVAVSGQLATATVATRLDAVRTDTTPAESVTYSTTDYMLFEWQGQGWRLIRWDEQPPGS